MHFHHCDQLTKEDIQQLQLFFWFIFYLVLFSPFNQEIIGLKFSTHILQVCNFNIFSLIFKRHYESLIYLRLDAFIDWSLGMFDCQLSIWFDFN